MSSDEQNAATKTSSEESTTPSTTSTENLSSEAIDEQERSEKILKAKELYSKGSRNFLVKSYEDAADELSEVCALYEEIYGELSDELGMPYLLYAKSLIALVLDENKVIDVPDKEEDGDEEDEEEEDNEAATESAAADTNGRKLESVKEDDVDSTEDKKKEEKEDEKTEEMVEDSAVTSTEEEKGAQEEEKTEEKKGTNGEANEADTADKDDEKPKTSSSITIDDGEKPSTSNGDGTGEEDDEAASNLQLAWETLELASIIFTRQGDAGRANLAEVQTELGNIEFENNILEAAREDYAKALNLYKELPSNYRRAMAEIHYKIGLSFLMEQRNQDGAASLKEACDLISGEIDEIKAKEDLSEKDRNNIQDMEETKQEIEAKILEIEETHAQNAADVRAALDSYTKPLSSGDVDAGSSKSATASAASSSLTADGTTSSSSSSKPTDISHLIKRKKPDEPSSEAEACSPTKRPAV